MVALKNQLLSTKTKNQTTKNTFIPNTRAVEPLPPFHPTTGAAYLCKCECSKKIGNLGIIFTRD